jgi:hypothetical protein
MSNLIKDDITNIREKLEAIESKLKNQMIEFEVREDIWGDLEKKSQIILDGQKSIIDLNIGGTKYKTTRQTLLSHRDTLFSKLITAEGFDLKEEVFIDRPSRFFPLILDYLREGKIDYVKMGKYQLNLLHDEVQYYGITELDKELQEFKLEISLVKLEISAPFKYNNQVLGTNTLEDLKVANNTTGVCVASPGWIIVELDRIWDISEIEVCGFQGKNTGAWGINNGANARILTSVDGASWVDVGALPAKLQQIQKVKLVNARGKYIKFNINGNLGLGYLYVHRKYT